VKRVEVLAGDVALELDNEFASGCKNKMRESLYDRKRGKAVNRKHAKQFV
jgi:hypothetical protein